jgi:hypothetical protein
MEDNYLIHYGVLGMKWGIRRYQNKDGTLTDVGKRHRRATLFVSGSSKTQDRSSLYYREKLPDSVAKQLDDAIKSNKRIIVGDAPGVDRQVQDYLNSKKYKKVEVYGPGKQIRYSANHEWKTRAIDDPDHEVGSKEWLAKKDEVMSKMATEGLAVVLDEQGAKATRNNIDRLIKNNKDVSVYMLSKNGNSYDREFSIEAFNSSMKRMESDIAKKAAPLFEEWRKQNWITDQSYGTKDYNKNKSRLQAIEEKIYSLDRPYSDAVEKGKSHINEILGSDYQLFTDEVGKWYISKNNHN